MHRKIDITVPVQATDSVLRKLREIEGVVALRVHLGSAVKPAGDVIGVTALNTAADDVIQAALAAEGCGSVSVSTSSVASLTKPDSSEQVRNDHDEALWEEAETAMRRHTRPNFNLWVTAGAGGVVATVGLAASSVTQATALVAAAVIAPVFEPLARIVLGVINQHRRALSGGLISIVAAYASVIVAAVLTMLVLRAAGPGYVHEFLRSPTVHEVEHPPLLNLLLSAGGAVAGAVMVAAGRFSVLAGPVIALQLMPALGTLGARLELGDGSLAANALARVAIDIGMVLFACLLVFGYKHLTVHQKRIARH